MLSDLAADLRAAIQADPNRFKAYRNNPLAFVRAVFPWGEPGTPLADEEGPDAWQADVLNDIGRGCRESLTANLQAVASGHGIGKTALTSWIIMWFISTRIDPAIVVTANTNVQLETKTWRELAKWHRLAKNGSAFVWTASKFYLKARPETHFAKAIPWSADRPEAFAGTHERDVLLVFDEASSIEDIIWETAEGALTTAGSVWCVFGNPTRNTGRFHACFNRYRHRWSTRQIDSRTARLTNKTQIAEWVEDYGEDSDFVRVRVRGVFPRAGARQFIPSDLVDGAAARSLAPDSFQHAPKLLCVDVARFGEDATVILRRQGLKVLDIKRYRGLDTMHVAALVAQAINDWQPDAVFVDDCGLGAGVVDRLRQLGHSVDAVNSGRAAQDSKTYFNLRAEMWGKMRDWLKTGSIPDDRELKDDLIGPEYGFDARDRIQLEKKEDMKKRGLASPDAADALALGFSRVVSTALDDLRGRYNDLRHDPPGSIYPLPEYLKM